MFAISATEYVGLLGSMLVDRNWLMIISPCIVSRSLQKWSYSARLPISILCYCFLPFLWFLWWMKISITSKHAGIVWPWVPYASNWTANADGYVLYANKTNVSLADLVKVQMLKFSVDCVFYNYFIAIQAAMHTRQSLFAIDTSSILLITAHSDVTISKFRFSIDFDSIFSPKWRFRFDSILVTPTLNHSRQDSVTTDAGQSSSKRFIAFTKPAGVC